MQIRLVTIDDYDALVSLWLECRGVGLSDVDDSREGIARLLERNPATCLAAVDENDQLIGSILAASDGRRGFVYHMAVAPQHRGQGVGEQLVQSAMTALQELGVSKVGLLSFTDNEAASAFWDRMGFTVRDDLTYRNRALIRLVPEG